MVDKQAIQHRALELVAERGSGVAPRLAEEFGLSRQAANQHLRALLASGLLEAVGKTRGRVYRLTATHEAQRRFAREGLLEDEAWREVFASAVADLPQNVRDIWHYGVTEMVNNAIDHSESTDVYLILHRNALFTEGVVGDNGIGIFVKIQQALELYDPREAILELAKGKLTTDPETHSGEGVFFTSRVFDVFLIRSGNLTFFHQENPLDFLVETPEPSRGTSVFMRLRNDSSRILKEVFDEFTDPDAYTFSKTIVPVRLAQYEGEKLVSRSQAKRLSMRFERFRNVILDFSGVVEIGQAFADELFRVFAQSHPSVVLAPTNMTPAVADMVARARAATQDHSVRVKDPGA